MTRFVGKVAISSIFDGFVACLAVPLVLWVPEGYPPFSGLKIRAGAPIKKIADIDAWRPEASMTGWPGWLACLAWLGWLGWISWNDWLNFPHARRSEEVGGYWHPL